MGTSLKFHGQYHHLPFCTASFFFFFGGITLYPFTHMMALHCGWYQGHIVDDEDEDTDEEDENEDESEDEYGDGDIDCDDGDYDEDEEEEDNCYYY